MLARLESEQRADQTVAPAAQLRALHNDHQKHDYWLALKARVDAGEQLQEDDEAFFASWQSDPYFRFMEEDQQTQANQERRATA